MLTTQHIQIVKSTVPLLEQGGVAITEHFYARLFRENPQLKNIFNMSHQKTGAQKVALFEAVVAYAKNIDNLSALKQAVERIAQKHTSFNIQPEQYDIVGHNLIETMRELLGDIFTPDVEEAWSTAYSVLANIFINREEEIYSGNENKQGGWRGKRAFRISEKTQESELVTSFIFVPVDEQGVSIFKPGQYLGVSIDSPLLENTEIRQYSLSDKNNGQSYRISVKKELGEHNGVASNFLHDHLNEGDVVDLYAPCGDFYYEDKGAPVILISGGVGITPMQSMLETLHNNGFDQHVDYIHACESNEQHSFNTRNSELTQSNNWGYHIWYTKDAEKFGFNSGYIDLSQKSMPIDNGDFYLCGPVMFMKFMKEQLVTLGVSDDRIHYEVFGPHASL
ncbi:NO-inducible flavohemoprotein [Vibrio sp.]|nr:NO-inducible flavohemoprotein [Vibrio sp.]